MLFFCTELLWSSKLWNKVMFLSTWKQFFYNRENWQDQIVKLQTYYGVSGHLEKHKTHCTKSVKHAAWCTTHNSSIIHVTTVPTWKRGVKCHDLFWNSWSFFSTSLYLFHHRIESFSSLFLSQWSRVFKHMNAPNCR